MSLDSVYHVDTCTYDEYNLKYNTSLSQASQTWQKSHQHPPAKAPKKKAAAKPKKAEPSVGELIVKAVSASKERSGVSLPALKKTLAEGGYDVENNNSCVKIAVKSLVTKGTLVQTKATSASGSFKLNKKAVEAKKPAKKAAAPEAKKVAAKKPAEAKKPKKGNSQEGRRRKEAAKSPKKVKKPAAAAKSPKKATKAAKPKAAKRKAAKAKKAAPKKK
ncbi:histone H1-like [Coregonus clupeaformis]|uniref:histone H1-like n=1 Tax=Coregonus clupeaformis TaxID=59861 RepID=UPI001E1C58C5|nr:histone H1-like [Coregonus clupeaformis]